MEPRITLVTLVVVPLANPLLDALRLHPEDFAAATLGPLVNAGYVALAGALAGVASILAGRRGARAWIAAGLFGLAGVVSVANALDPTLGTRRSPVEIGIVGLALGPLVVSLGSGPRALGVLAVAQAAGFVALLGAPDAVGGMVNRLWDGLAALWIVVFALSAERGGIMRTPGEVA